VPSSAELYDWLLCSPQLTASPAARSDLESGLVSPALVSLLASAAERFAFQVRTIKSGHPMGPVSPAGKPNSHYFYCAADIHAVDGQDVGTRPIPEPVVLFGRWLMSLDPPLRPCTVMGPGAWHAALGPGDRRGFRGDEFANRIHGDHLHLALELPDAAVSHGTSVG
jgi:hypothetical protein